MGIAFFLDKFTLLFLHYCRWKQCLFFLWKNCLVHNAQINSFHWFFFNASLQQITIVLLQCFPKRVPENTVFSPQVQNKNVLHLCPSGLHNGLISRFVCFTRHFQRSVAMKTSDGLLSVLLSLLTSQGHILVYLQVSYRPRLFIVPASNRWSR